MRGGMALRGSPLIIKASRASLMSCLLLNPHTGCFFQNDRISAERGAVSICRVFDSVVRASEEEEERVWRSEGR